MVSRDAGIVVRSLRSVLALARGRWLLVAEARGAVGIVVVLPCAGCACPYHVTESESGV